MKTEQPFSTIKLMNGDECTIYEAKAGDLMRAQFQTMLHDGKKPEGERIGFTPYFWLQVIKINGKGCTIDELMALSVDDYLSISNVIDVSMKKITGLGL